MRVGTFQQTGCVILCLIVLYRSRTDSVIRVGPHGTKTTFRGLQRWKRTLAAVWTERVVFVNQSLHQVHYRRYLLCLPIGACTSYSTHGTYRLRRSKAARATAGTARTVSSKRACISWTTDDTCGVRQSELATDHTLSNTIFFAQYIAQLPRNVY